MEQKINYYELIHEILDEKGLKTSDLEKHNVLKKDVLNKFKKRAPSMKNAIAVANFLECSWDFIIENTLKNNIKKYKEDQASFYENLTFILKTMEIPKIKCLEI